MFGIAIHTIPSFQKQTDQAGVNPFACLGFEIKDGTLYFKEWNGEKWVWSPDLRSIPASTVCYRLNGRTNMTFDGLFPTYDWTAHRGFEHLGSLVESAAASAGR